MRLTGAFSIAVMASALAIPAAAQAPGTRLPNAASLNAAAVQFLLQDEVKWSTPLSAPNAAAIIAGDPTKPGLYVQLTKWRAGNNFSRPHFHPNDRYITVLKGTWWVGSGNKFDPASTVPMPAGTVVTHFGKQVHYDGAKDEDAVLLIVGEGPATLTRVEEAK